jgi:hypothetical protein
MNAHQLQSLNRHANTHRDVHHHSSVIAGGAHVAGGKWGRGRVLNGKGRLTSACI